ncbi:MAG: hypothetical protein WBA93_05655 [Microcoleaceae cyanobacterium]
MYNVLTLKYTLFDASYQQSSLFVAIVASAILPIFKIKYLRKNTVM